MTIRRDEMAVSEVVGFLLLLGILFAVFSLFLLYAVPADGRDSEIAHMKGVEQRFISYKGLADSLWINGFNYSGSVPANYSTYGVTLSTSLDLGTGAGVSVSNSGSDVPFISPSPSAGAVTINSRLENMTIDTSYFASPYTYTMGDITYDSDNRYWIDQEYYYQAGGLFLTQDSGSVSRLSPLISFYQVIPEGSPSAIPKVKIVALEIDGDQNIAGSGPVLISSRLREGVAESSYRELAYVRITVHASDEETALMWQRLFAQLLSDGGIDDPLWYVIGQDSPTDVWIEITGADNRVDLDLIRVSYVVTVQSAASFIT